MVECFSKKNRKKQRTLNLPVTRKVKRSVREKVVTSSEAYQLFLKQKLLPVVKEGRLENSFPSLQLTL